nr:hypothetical protein [Arenibacter arenosicollis]
MEYYFYSDYMGDHFVGNWNLLLQIETRVLQKLGRKANSKIHGGIGNS